MLQRTDVFLHWDYIITYKSSHSEVIMTWDERDFAIPWLSLVHRLDTRYQLQAYLLISRLCILFLKWFLFLLRIFAGKLFQVTAPDLENLL